MNTEKIITRSDIVKMARKKKNANDYEKRKLNQIYCESCCISVDKYYYDTHCCTKRHQKYKDIYKELQNKIN